jgi:hypothetical protein
MRFLFLLALIGCVREPLLSAGLHLEAEPTAEAQGEVHLTNRWPFDTLIIAEIGFSPDEANLRWSGSGPFELKPRSTSELFVHFEPEEIGEWNETLILTTTAGELTVPLHLRAAVLVDMDGDQWSVAMGDCDDNDANRNPGELESCDEIDNNCDGEIDEGFDQDGDGYLDATACTHGEDCDDTDPTAWPGRTEECDQTDSNCNGLIDDIGLLADLQEGVCAGSLKECTFGGPREPDYSRIDDYEPLEFQCDGKDNDCDGQIDGFDYRNDGTSDCIDDDGDGASESQGDCNDHDSELRPADCLHGNVAITSLDDGYLLVDLNTFQNQHFTVGTPTYHGSAINLENLWFTNRSNRELWLATPSTSSFSLIDTFDAETMAVLPSKDGEFVYILLGDGQLLVRSLLDDSTVTIELEGNPTAMAQDGNLLWICTSDGYLSRVNTTTLVSTNIFTGAECFGPPIVDTANDRILVPGYLNYTIVSVDRTLLTIGETINTSYRILRGAFTPEALWVSTGVDHRLQKRDPDSLEVLLQLDFVTPIQGLWWDPIRADLWLALYDTGDIYVLAEDGRTHMTLELASPVYLFGVP